MQASSSSPGRKSIRQFHAAYSGHKCPKDGCHRNVPTEQLCCRTHWYQLSKAVRDAVNRSWRSDDHSGHREAIRAALEELNGEAAK